MSGDHQTPRRGLKLWTGKRLGKRTSERVDRAEAVLGVPSTKAAKWLKGEMASLCELLVVTHIAHRVAWSDTDEEKANACIDALLAQIEEQAAEIAKWAIEEAENATPDAQKARPT